MVGTDFFQCSQPSLNVLDRFCDSAEMNCPAVDVDMGEVPWRRQRSNRALAKGPDVGPAVLGLQQRLAAIFAEVFGFVCLFV